jgi:hypothetical protein
MCHYIHLNPVRAGLVEASCLEQYADSSFAGLWYPRRRRGYEHPELALECAGGLLDTPAIRRKYRDYLGWLSETDEEAKRLGFEDMTKGWAKGTAEFKRSILEDLKDEQVRKVVELEASEIREPAWARTLSSGLIILGRRETEMEASRKGADWKVALSRLLRERHLTPYRWIATNLKMGAPSYVQSLVCLNRKKKDSKLWELLQKQGKLD